MNRILLVQAFLFFWILSMLVLFLPKNSFAARDITISSGQSVIHGYDEMTVTISSMSGFTNGETIYIKGAFYNDGSTNYFGFTKNNNDWIKNGDATASQKQVKIGDWDRSLVVKSDFDDSGYQGEGEYKLKVGFYYITSGGNISSINWSANSLTITINNPNPTPTPTNPPATNTIVPTNTPKAPTNTPKPLPTATLKPTFVIKPNPSFALASPSSVTSISGVLGSSISGKPTLVERMSEKKSQPINMLAIFSIVGGILLLVSCGILFFYKWKKVNELNENTDE